MQFTADREALVQGIAAAERAVSDNDSMPILSGILLDAQDSSLRLVSTDFEIGIETRVPVEVQQPGSAVLNGRLLAQIVRKIDGSAVRYQQGGGKGRLESGGARFTVPFVPGDEFPDLPAPSGEAQCRVEADSLRRAIRQTVFATNPEETPPVLTGVLLEVADGELILAATDVNRIAIRRIPLLGEAPEGLQAVLPARTMNELAKLLDGQEVEEAGLVLEENQALFTIGPVQLVSRVIEGRFPDHRGILQRYEQIGSEVRVERAAFMDAVDRAALVAGRRGVPWVRLSASEGNRLVIESRQTDVGEAYEELSASLEGEKVESAFQARYLLEMLRAVSSEELVMAFAQEIEPQMRPVYLRDPEETGYIYLVMPTRV